MSAAGESISPKRRARRATTTSNFGVGSREGHDASAFYARFRAPDLSADDTVAAPVPVAEPFVHGDARHLDTVADGSVALVVTSPPYFAGKQYEEELEREGIPASYLEYLQMLTDVFAECVRKLEPGGRIAVNVANLGRKPYRSLSADVIGILGDELGLLLRGEVIWQKADGASGSCAWGSFRSATNPVLRDVSERVIIASKGRFDRARSIAQRTAEGLPHRSTVLTDDFLNLTLDVWSIPPESARRVGHPAPFPVELPEQLIRLYTYADDLVLDPFMGSGSSLVAAARLGRRYVGYDLDAAYVEMARERVAAAIAPNDPTPDDPPPGAPASGKGAKALAGDALVDAGFRDVAPGRRVRGTGIAVDLTAVDAAGTTWHVEVPGAHVAHRGGLRRTDAVWRALGRASVLRGSGIAPVLLLAPGLPPRGTEAHTVLHAAGPDAFFDAVDLLDAAGLGRLARYAAGGAERPEPGFWRRAPTGFAGRVDP